MRCDKENKRPSQHNSLHQGSHRKERPRFYMHVLLERDCGHQSRSIPFLLLFLSAPLHFINEKVTLLMTE